MNSKEIEWDIFFCRMHGMISSDEEMKFREWYDASQIHRNYYARMEREWKDEPEYKTDLPKVISEFDTLMNRRNRRQKNRSFFRYAAVVGLFILTAVGTCKFLHEYANLTPEPARIIQPGYSQATLILSSGQQVDVNNLIKDSLVRLDDAEVIREEGTISYLPDNDIGDDVIYNTLVIPRGGEYRLILADGSRVWLNSQTALRFPINNAGDSRTVFLSGEAYFEVENDENRPFVVSTDIGDVRVYGTVFNVKYYLDQPYIKATLVEGSVGFSSPLVNDVVIKPGYCLTHIAGSNTCEIEKVKVADEVAWKSNLLSFEKQSLQEIMLTLERWYDIDVHFESEVLKKLIFSGSINRYENFCSFKELFEASAAIKFDIEGKNVTVRQK